MYEWFLIPSDFPALDPAAYNWQPQLGTKGKKKGQQNGWETNEVNGSKMSITFSMSSQLWIKVNANAVKEFLISSCLVDIGRKMTYIDLFDNRLKVGHK